MCAEFARRLVVKPDDGDQYAGCMSRTTAIFLCFPGSTWCRLSVSVASWGLGLVHVHGIPTR